MKRIILTIISLNVLSLFSYSNSWKGLGTEDEPYLISSPQQMAELAEEVNNGTDFQNIFFSLTNDIDLSELYKDSLDSWTPIGSASYDFNGTFLGNNYTVNNIHINVEENDFYFGLFGSIGEHGAVQDLTIESGVIHSTLWSGGIAAINSGIISNCRNINCSVNSWRYAGGICGVNLNTITNCSNLAEVYSSLCSGGICSYNYGTITNCTNRQGITSNKGCGGICGYNGGFADISNCYNVKIGFIDNCTNHSSIMGDEKIGGIAGRNDGFIVNSRNNGVINGDQQVGGIAGVNGGFDGVIGNITNSFNLGNVIGRDTLAGGIVGFGNQASEIFNVCTTDNIHCVNTSTTDYIGEDNGLRENCFILHQYDETTNYDSIVNQLNHWITIQPNQDSYLKWGFENNKFCTIMPDTTMRDSTLYDHANIPLYNKNLDEIKIFCGKGYLYIISPARQSVVVYRVDGKAIRSVDLSANAMARIQIERGVYIVNGQKVVVF